MSMDVTHLSFTIAYRLMINDLMFNVTDRERTLFLSYLQFSVAFFASHIHLSSSYCTTQLADDSTITRILELKFMIE